jgi:hypothetical protein
VRLIARGTCGQSAFVGSVAWPRCGNLGATVLDVRGISNDDACAICERMFQISIAVLRSDVWEAGEVRRCADRGRGYAMKGNNMIDLVVLYKNYQPVCSNHIPLHQGRGTRYANEQLMRKLHSKHH